jgi:hypothetical protein
VLRGLARSAAAFESRRIFGVCVTRSAKKVLHAAAFTNLQQAFGKFLRQEWPSAKA